MKRAILLSVVFLCSSVLFAQIRGVPASVTSFTGGRTMAPGVPASVTSLGPHGYTGGPCLGVLGCTNPFFQSTINFQNGTVQLGGRGHGNGGGHHHPRGGGYVGGYSYPYPVYVPVPVEDQQQAIEEEQQSAEPPAQTIYERRPYVRLAPNPTPAENLAEPVEEQPVAKHHNMSPVADDGVPVVVVFKDGHTQEIKNYAIVGDTLYDLGNLAAKKIKMADIDVKTTIQKNEDRGVEFSVPLAYRPAA